MATIALDTGGASLFDALHDQHIRDALEQKLPGFLQEQRWFAGRAHGVNSVRIEHMVPLSDDGSLVSTIVDVNDGAGAMTRYQVLLEQQPGSVVGDPLAGRNATALRDLLQRGGRREAEGVRFVAAGPGGDDQCAGNPRPLGAEQSNSSVVFGDECIMKVFRIIQDGWNPDVQLTAWLSGPGGFPNVPRVIGTARLQAPGLDADAAVLQEFVPNEGDGWSWILERARAACANAMDGTSMRAYLAEEQETLSRAAELGDITAQLHATLSRADEPGMTPAAATVSDWEAWQEELQSNARDTAAMLQPTNPELAERVSTLSREASTPAPVDLGMKTRVHGDFHLGQVLRTERGWIIIDFEGEPARPLAERVALQHPLADVAGMLRSWDYAARTAGQGSEAAAAWGEAVSDAYLAAYWETADTAERPFLPAGDEARATVLRLFTLRKALYEVRYELGSRPDWVWVPVGAVAAMLDDTR